MILPFGYCDFLRNVDFFGSSFGSILIRKKPGLMLIIAGENPRPPALTDSLATASQSGGWVPEMSKSFHYWQPAPRLKPLPWLAIPGSPAMSPHAEGKRAGTRHTDKTVEEGGKGGGGGSQ